MCVKARWSFGFFAVHLRDGNCYCFRAIAMRCDVEVDDVFNCCVPALSVPSVTVVSDVVCASQYYNPRIFGFCCLKKV